MVKTSLIQTKDRCFSFNHMQQNNCAAWTTKSYGMIFGTDPKSLINFSGFKVFRILPEILILKQFNLEKIIIFLFGDRLEGLLFNL